MMSLDILWCVLSVFSCLSTQPLGSKYICVCCSVTYTLAGATDCVCVCVV